MTGWNSPVVVALVAIMLVKTGVVEVRVAGGGGGTLEGCVIYTTAGSMKQIGRASCRERV